MSLDKGLFAGSTSLLLLKLLEEKDMYGYEMIETLRERSQNVFALKAGTLYPLLHALESQGAVTSYESKTQNTKLRRYYRITKQGHALLKNKKEEWESYTKAVNQVLGGGGYAITVS